MKRLFFFFTALVALGVVSCQKEIKTSDEIINPETGMQKVSITAISEGMTKTAYSDAGVFGWQSGDKVSVLCTDGKFYEFETEDSGSYATFTGTIPSGEELGSFAFFPADDNHNPTGPVFRVPKEKDLRPNGSADLPMYGKKGAGNSFSFTHMTGAFKLTINNFPSDITYATISIKNGSLKLSGDFNISSDGDYHKYSAKGSTDDDETAFIRTVPVTDRKAEVYVPYAYGYDYWAESKLNVTGYNSSNESTKFYTDLKMKGYGTAHARATVIPYTPLLIYNTPNFSLPEVVSMNCGSSYTQVTQMKAYADKGYLHIQFYGNTENWTGTHMNLYIYDGGEGSDVPYDGWSIKTSAHEVHSSASISTSALSLSMGGKTCTTSVTASGDNTYWTISIPRTANLDMMGAPGTVYIGLVIQDEDDSWACTGAIPKIWVNLDMLAVTLP